MRTLAEYQTLLRRMMRFLARETEFFCDPPLTEILQKHPRLIIALNHGSPLSWLPSAAVLAMAASQSGGAARCPIGVMDRFFFRWPLIREIAQSVTQTQRPLSFFELSDRFERGEKFDLLVFPEGSNCFFGHPDDVQEFRSNKFIELAIVTGTPLLIGAHEGSESWATAWQVPSEIIRRLNFLPSFAFKFAEERLKRSGLFVIPLWPKPMARFQMYCELYRPQLLPSDLHPLPDERRRQLREEAERIRARLKEMLVVLRRRSTSGPPRLAAGVVNSGITLGRAPPSFAKSNAHADMITNLNNL